ncbi:MAG: protein kinase [Legionellaceae bacterium]|nr:protein kinase [Legionellaceae bacterium]
MLNVTEHINLTNEILGEGAFGVVKKGYWNEIPVACKKIDLNNDSALIDFQNEFTIQHKLQHQNIVGMLFESVKYGILGMELMSQALDKLVYQQNVFINEITQLRIIKDIATGLAYIHDNNILHRDIKVENILLDQQLTAKISDFGFATTATDGVFFDSSAVCTPYYAAPELLSVYFDNQIKNTNNNYSYSEESDNYAFGILCSAIILKQMPYSSFAIEATRLCGKIIEGLRDALPLDTPKILAEIITNCVAQNPKDRKKIKSFIEILSSYEQTLVQSNSNKVSEVVGKPLQDLPMRERGAKLFSGKAHFWNNQNEKQLRSNTVCNHTYTSIAL